MCVIPKADAKFKFTENYRLLHRFSKGKAPQLSQIRPSWLSGWTNSCNLHQLQHIRPSPPTSTFSRNQSQLRQSPPTLGLTVTPPATETARARHLNKWWWKLGETKVIRVQTIMTWRTSWGTSCALTAQTICLSSKLLSYLRRFAPSGSSQLVSREKGRTTEVVLKKVITEIAFYFKTNLSDLSYSVCLRILL